MNMDQPLSTLVLTTNEPAINRAFRIAMGDLSGNIQPFKDGLLDEACPVILAGLDYDTPWTRDAAINVWNGLGLAQPHASRNTLLAVLERSDAGIRIGGQYWDAIIWAMGAWAYYLYTGDRDFLRLAEEAVRNSLRRFEAEERDPETGLFRGPAVYGDGVAAYPDRYSPGGTSSILDWVRANPGKRAPAGYGIPMHALSTNCVYAQAYRVAGQMRRELGLPEDAEVEAQGEALAERIRQRYWNHEKGTFNYILDAQGGSDHQEGLGHAFALLFGLADADQARLVLDRQVITPHGIPCVWPSYARYTAQGGFGRHSGTVWPFISAFWGEAALLHHRPDLFEREFKQFTDTLNRHGQCAEIVHPETGEVYGGLQENGSGPDGLQWASCMRQTWSASAYLRMVLTGLLGLRFSTAGLTFAPHLPAGLQRVHLSGLSYRGSSLEITVLGQGSRITAFQLDGEQVEPALRASLTGQHTIEVWLA